MDTLRVRAYNVRFGDAILITVPDRDETGVVTKRHILIDVGNVLVGAGGQDEIFEPVIQDILAELDGKPLDLYVMTHEHMDHVQGLFWAKVKKGLDIKATHAWLTASAAPDYRDRFPQAVEKRLALEEVYDRISLYFETVAQAGPFTSMMLLNNNPRSTKECVDFLRGVGQKATYVFRDVDISEAHPFHEAKFEIWGPEEDTSTYYGRFRPMGFGLAAAGADDGNNATRDTVKPKINTPLPPPGVDAGAFYNLVDRRRRGIFDNLLAIDKAANNTSVVFLLEWRGWRLLFPGDAEERSWREMNKRSLLKPVHFLKVGHHGSHNGTPAGELLDTILPPETADGRPRAALVSTFKDTYNNVPDTNTLQVLGQRCEVVQIGEESDALFADLFFSTLN